MTAYLINLIDGLRRWHIRRKTADTLRRLDDHMLHDIGLARGDIEFIAARQAADRVAEDRARTDRARRRHAVPGIVDIAQDVAFRGRPCATC